MIDIENKVFTIIKKGLADESIQFSSDIAYTPTTLPAVSIVETDNTNYAETIDSGSIENHIEVMFTINIWTERVESLPRKSEAKKIANKIDEIMLKMGFSRIIETQIPDDSYYRLTIEYQGVVSRELDGTNYVFRR